MFLFLISFHIIAQNAWINEFHYDNSGSPDIGEFVEIAIENSSSYNLDDFRISFYSSSSGIRYGIYHHLNSFDIGSTDNGITLYSKFISGIQNGPNDGIALDFQGTVLHFISYEGIVTGSEGVADGITSQDVGVSETNSTPPGSSIGLSGNGVQLSNFNWVILPDDSPGAVNNNQVLPVELTRFSASIDDRKVRLSWETATEINNYGFDIERASAPVGMDDNFIQIRSVPQTGGEEEWEKIGFVEGHGNSNSKRHYIFNDIPIGASVEYFYRLKQIDIDGKYKYSNVLSVEVNAPENFELLQNYPNPFNPTTTIAFSVPYVSNIELSIFNVLGEKIKVLINGEKIAGFYKVEFNGQKLSSGIYFVQLQGNHYRKIKKMLLIK